MTLSGWHRLWVLVSVLWAALCLALVALSTSPAPAPALVLERLWPNARNAIIDSWWAWDTHHETPLRDQSSELERILKRSPLPNAARADVWDDAFQTTGPEQLLERLKKRGLQEDLIEQVMSLAARHHGGAFLGDRVQVAEHVLLFRWGASPPYGEYVATAYHRAYAGEARWMLLSMWLMAFTAALLPPVALYGLGLAVAWVWRGFVPSGS